MKTALKFLGVLMGGIPERFTPEWLDEAHAKAEAAKCTGGIVLPECFWVSGVTRLCAQQMKASGVKETVFIGPLRPNPFRNLRGELLQIPKGAVYHRRGEVVICLRRSKVKLHSSYEGYFDEHNSVVVGPSIRWVSAGGYFSDMRLEENPTLEFPLSLLVRKAADSYLSITQ
jgi:hypothetical protein